MHASGRLALLLLFGAVLAAIAAWFGPAQAWGGVDIGSTGATAFVLILAAAIGLFATRGEQVFPEHMSIVERRAWIGLAFLVLILVDFTREMAFLYQRPVIPESPRDLLMSRFVQRCGLLLGAWGVISSLIGRQQRGVQSDERDLRLRHRADRAGDWALTLIVVGAIVVLASVPRALLSWWLAPIVLANVLIGLLMAKSLVEHVVLAFSYRSFAERA